jgi:hypothetical protein
MPRAKKAPDVDWLTKLLDANPNPPFLDEFHAWLDAGKTHPEVSRLVRKAWQPSRKTH